MKAAVAQLLDAAVATLPELADVAASVPMVSTLERTKDVSHGDFASNIAMRAAKKVGRNPRELAAAIVDAIPASDTLSKVDIAGPGFINFTLSDAAYHAELTDILEQGEMYGRRPIAETPRVLLEYVSANPTGPLHVGHGRGAAYGATVGNLLKATGVNVDHEYYVNDAGRQMDILGLSVYLRWLESQDRGIPFPNAGYKGDYIKDIAIGIESDNLDAVSTSALLAEVPKDGDNQDAKEAHINALITSAKSNLGSDVFDAVRQQSMDAIRQDIEQDLGEFGVHFDCWFSEKSLTTEGRVDAALAVLQERGMLYEKDGATWFCSEKFGDEKDRVVQRANGERTYFASDIAYHFDKRERGYDVLIDILGADHHGYVARVRAGLEAMGYAGDDLDVKLIQFVALYRGKERLGMSTRSGEFVTLRELRDEVGNDAARLFYVMRSIDQHLDFDLELAKSQSNDNPVYYIQYAHARIASVFRQLDEKSLSFDSANGLANLDSLTEPHEKALMTVLSRFPEMLDLAAKNLAPQHMVHYLRDLATEFHSYYNAHAFIVDDANVRDARLSLVTATRIVIASGLALLGISAPEKM
ncbi:MAG: arginine--tRNA ligase [Pseudomonadota bacterium]